MADVITRFKLETTQYDSKLRDASKGLADIVRQASLAGNEFGKFTQKSVESARALGNIQTSSSNAKDKVKELVGAFNDVARQYNVLTKEQQQSDFGKALAESMTKLKGRIGEAKQEMMSMGSAMSSGGGIGGGLGNLNGLLSQMGSQLGINTSLLSSFSAGSLTAATGVGAVALAIGAATKELIDFNSELAKQQQITTVTTGLTGGDAASMTAEARAVADVYGTDFREVINAANVLMTQFGKSGDEAMKLIRDGMQGMIQGDGPKLLQLIQQYAPSFRDAGIEASQLVAIIQNSEGGLFTVENMNAIVMGIKNIRLMTKSTNDALNQIGIDGEEITRKLNDGTMTIFDALGMVSQALQNVESGSQNAGQVMQAVFGRQGTAAGTNLAKAIAELNTNLDETKMKTGDVGQAMAELTRQTTELENKLMDVFGLDGWDVMATKLETEVIFTLSQTVEWIRNLKNLMISLADTYHDVAEANPFPQFIQDAVALLTPLTAIVMLIDKIRGGSGSGRTGGGTGFKGIGSAVSNSMVNTYNNRRGLSITTDSNGNVIKATRDGKDVTSEFQTKSQTGGITTKTTKKGGGGNKTPKTEEQLNNEQIAKLTREFEKASEDRRKAIQEEIKALQDRNFEIKTYQDLATGKVKARSQIAQGEGMMSLTGGFMNDVAKSLINPDKISPDAIVTPLERMNEELKKLIELRDKAFTSEGWQVGDVLVRQKQKEIAAYKGEGKEEKKENKSVVGGIDRLTGSMSQMVSGMEQLGIEVPSEIRGVVSGIQGVTTILTAIASIVSAIQVIVGATSFIPFFARGGVVPHAAGGLNVVPGNSFSGDLTPVMANAGEVVLNRAQTNTIANLLEGGGASQRVEVEGFISGENIRLALRNNGLRAGRGEYVMTKRM